MKVVTALILTAMTVLVFFMAIQILLNLIRREEPTEPVSSTSTPPVTETNTFEFHGTPAPEK